jgi:anti-sigma B factor antagonist
VNPNFRVETESLGEIYAINVRGELDQATAPELEQALGNRSVSENGGVFIDLTDCEFIDSTGLSLLVEANRRLTTGGRGFAVCCPRTEVRRLLELTGIDGAIGLYDSRDDAIASLDGAE